MYPARVVYPTEQVISALHTTYQVALRLNLWSITPSILSLPKVEGGGTQSTHTQILCTVAACVVIHPLPQKPRNHFTLVPNHFQGWAKSNGPIPTLQFLPYFQIGSNVV